MGHPSEPSPICASRSRIFEIFAAFAVIGLLALHLAALLHHPIPSCDEAVYSAAAYSVLTAGRFGVPLVENLAGIGDNYIPLGRLLLLGQALFQLALSADPLLSAHLFSLTGVAVLALASYALVAMLHDRRMGIWAALLVTG